MRFLAGNSGHHVVEMSRLKPADLDAYSTPKKLLARKGTKYYLVAAYFIVNGIADEGNVEVFTNKREAIAQAKRWAKEIAKDDEPG